MLMHFTNMKHGLRNTALIAAVLTGSILITACSGKHVAGGVLGGAAVGGAYEYQNREAVKELERDLNEGRITREEYERERKRIDDRSIIY